MRGTALVLTLAFVFASGAMLVGPASAQESKPEPSPEPYQQQPTDATVQGRVTDGAGNPIAGARVYAYNYGSPMPVEGTSSGGGSSGSAGSSEPASADGSASSDARSMPYYGGNETATDADGRYVLGVYSGQNQVTVQRDGYAQRWATVEVAAGQTATQDVQLEKYPDKTARIEGRVTDARSGRGLSFASVSVSSPVHGLYECSVRDGQQGGGSGGSGGTEPAPMPAEDSGVASTSIVAPDWGYRCAITVFDDGRYEGLVTPGYAIVSVHAYADCAVSSDSGGSSSCGPQYFSFSRTLSLPANETTTVNVALRSQPAPDAVVSGYLVDAESGQAIPGAQISFSNQETWGWGYATTDRDGSYSLRLRSGYHTVSVWAEGHLPWEGVLDVRSGDSDFDVRLTPGQASYGGGCCYALDGLAAERGAAGAPPPAAMGGAGSDSASDEDGAQQLLYEDLGGGLGPYDASKRQQALAGGDEGSNGAPGLGLLALLGALAVALVAMRRRA